MSRFDSPLSYAILFVGIVIASTVLILLVTADAKHRKGPEEDHNQQQDPNESLLTLVRRRWTEFWYGKPDGNSTTVIVVETVETHNQVSQRWKREADSMSSGKNGERTNVPS